MANSIDDQINELKDSLKKIKDQLGKGKKLIPLVILIILGLSSFVQIETEEVGVVTRFGKYNRELSPGLNFKIPFIDKVTKVAVERQLKEAFGFIDDSMDLSGNNNRLSSISNTKKVNSVESLMLTGDLNLADVQWVVQYRISDPYLYLFKVRDPRNTLRDISEAVMRELVGDRTVNEVITVGRSEIAIKLNQQLQSLCNDYSLGIEIDQVVLQNVFPPEPVKAAFNAVNEAEQEKETLINEAEAEYNKVIPRAKGEAEETIQQAEGYATERVNNAKGEVARFNDIYKEYIKATEVTRKRIYLETMAEVIPNLRDKIIIDEKGNSVLPLLNLKNQ